MFLIDRRKRWSLLSLAVLIPLAGLLLAWAGKDNITVNVCGMPTAYLNPIASQIYRGQSVTLTWSTTEAHSLESNFGATGLSGSIQKRLNTTGKHTFTLKAKSKCREDMDTFSRSVVVVEPPPPPPPPRNYHRCFVAGTKILMADGSYKNVEDVKLGETLRSYDVALGKYVDSKVTYRNNSSYDSFFQINGSNGVTGPHEFFANGKWTRVDELKVGDVLINEKGEPITIETITKRPGPVDIFPLFVEDPPASYFAEGILVHNKDKEHEKGEGLLAGTMVLMSDGSRKPIEQVRAGEGLMSYFPDKMGMGTAKVKSTSKDTVAEYVVINGKLSMGPNHRIIKSGPAKDKGEQKP